MLRRREKLLITIQGNFYEILKIFYSVENLFLRASSQNETRVKVILLKHSYLGKDYDPQIPKPTC